jgi:hypothetical protein
MILFFKKEKKFDTSFYFYWFGNIMRNGTVEGHVD